MIAQGIDIQKALDCAERVFSAHLPGYTLGAGCTNSPFRVDKIPSFQVKWIKGKWRYTDFGNSELRGDVIDFVRRYYNLDFNSAVEKIVSDFNSNVPSRKMDNHCLKKISKKDSKSVELDVKSRLYTFEEIQFWNEFGISKTTLDRYNVKAVKFIFINKSPILAAPFTFAFEEYKDGKISHKIYQPLNKENKWMNKHKWDVVQGWSQMVLKGKLLIITKSLKDTMLLAELGYNAIAPQSETSFLKKHILEQLKKRFEKIIIFLDNDEVGIKQAKLYSEQFNLPYIHIPIGEPKDISDYYFKYKEEQTKQLIDELLNYKRSNPA